MISSDFCHWGQRFRYTQYDQEAGEIYQSIEALDKQVLLPIATYDSLILISTILYYILLVILGVSDFCHWGQRFRYTQYDQEYIVQYGIQ